MSKQVKVLDHGHVHFIGSMATDLDVVNAARVSLNSSSTWEVETEVIGEGAGVGLDFRNHNVLSDRDKGLIKFLMRERHGTPFEHGYFKFRVKAPLFVFREWHRHRVGHSYNEWSARYSKLEPEFYVPDKVLVQAGKPGAYTFLDAGQEKTNICRNYLLASYRESYATYEFLLDQGISKQQARLALPVATYSEMIWSCNPRSLMHFLSLRDSEHAQHEIREYAKVIAEIFSSIMPVTYEAFVSNGHKAP
jgi:thymidylate synthase (FAD)